MGKFNSASTLNSKINFMQTDIESDELVGKSIPEAKNALILSSYNNTFDSSLSMLASDNDGSIYRLTYDPTELENTISVLYAKIAELKEKLNNKINERINRQNKVAELLEKNKFIIPSNFINNELFKKIAEYLGLNTESIDTESLNELLTQATQNIEEDKNNLEEKNNQLSEAINRSNNKLPDTGYLDILHNRKFYWVGGRGGGYGQSLSYKEISKPHTIYLCDGSKSEDWSVSFEYYTFNSVHASYRVEYRKYASDGPIKKIENAFDEVDENGNYKVFNGFTIRYQSHTKGINANTGDDKYVAIVANDDEKPKYYFNSIEDIYDLKNIRNYLFGGDNSIYFSEIFCGHYTYEVRYLLPANEPDKSKTNLTKLVYWFKLKNPVVGKQQFMLLLEQEDSCNVILATNEAIYNKTKLYEMPKKFVVNNTEEWKSNYYGELPPESNDPDIEEIDGRLLISLGNDNETYEYIGVQIINGPTGQSHRTSVFRIGLVSKTDKTYDYYSLYSMSICAVNGVIYTPVTYKDRIEYRATFPSHDGTWNTFTPISEIITLSTPIYGPCTIQTLKWVLKESGGTKEVSLLDKCKLMFLPKTLTDENVIYDICNNRDYDIDHLINSYGVKWIYLNNNTHTTIPLDPYVKYTEDNEVLYDRILIKTDYRLETIPQTDVFIRFAIVDIEPS